ncbi:hypothetical protein Tco_1137769 [Tanacetum coccineum]
MSGSEPGEMAPESLKVVVFPKFDMHIYTSELTSSELGKAIEEYDIPLDLHPHLPPLGMTMNKLPSRYIGLYIEQLEHGGLRVPFSSFFLAVIKHFGVHVSQLVPMGVNRVTGSLSKTRPEVLNRSFSDILHLEGIWKIYTWLGLIWRRNGQDYRPAPTSLKIMFSEAGDGVTDSTYDYSSVAKGDLMKFSDIGAWDDMVRVQVPRCMAWLDYDDRVDSLSTMDNEVGVTSPESTTQTLPSFEEYTPPVTYPEEVENTLGTSIEVEPLNETKLEEVGLNFNHNTPLSSREVPSFD